jgi:hypothetical protein
MQSIVVDHGAASSADGKRPVLLVMRTRNSTSWLIGTLLAAGTVGCFAQDNPEIPRLTVSSPEAAAALVQEFQATDPATTTPAFTEFAKLALAGIDEQVMLRVITNTPDAYRLGVDQILWLRDVGVAKEVINAMIAHDLEVNSRQVAQALATPSPPVRIPWPASWLKPADAPVRTAVKVNPQASTPAPAPPSKLLTNRPASAPPALPMTVAVGEPVQAPAGAGFSPTTGSVGEVPSVGRIPSEQKEEATSEYWRNPYPVRLPYPVKLLDPIIIMVTPW